MALKLLGGNMAGLNEQFIYEPIIYQLEATDPVQGGANGIDNLPHKQLANRTHFLDVKITGHIGDINDPHVEANYAKAEALRSHELNTVDPHANAGYNKQVSFDAHVNDTGDPHASAGYAEKSVLDSHIADSNDPHALAGYAKEDLVYNHINDSNDPHSAAGYATEGDVTYEIGLHAIAANPHPQYATVGGVASEIGSHTNAPNPHPQYATAAAVNTAISDSSNVYTAGAGIAISPTNVISTTGDGAGMRLFQTPVNLLGLTSVAASGPIPLTGTESAKGLYFTGSLSTGFGNSTATLSINGTRIGYIRHDDSSSACVISYWLYVPLGTISVNYDFSGGADLDYLDLSGVC